jgi:predicted molibdopterin-dependent oxidoreductase YjgC
MSKAITIMVDGQPVAAQAGQTVAAALIAAGWRSFGANPKTGAPLAPFCLMGVCFGCLCEIDGRPGEQACLQPVREGLAVRLGSET